MKSNKLYKILGIILVIISFFSCENVLKDDSFITDNELEITISNDEIVLNELYFNNTVNFNWTTGSNQNTGSTIKYTLKIDVAQGDFSNPITTLLDQVKNTFSYSITFGDLNNILLTSGLDMNQTYDLKAKIIATVSNESVKEQVSTVSFSATTFKPVSNQLFIVGDATPNGWDIENAIELNSSTNKRGVYIYRGKLSTGKFKFPVSNDGCFCQDFYTQDPNDSTKIVYNQSGSGDDLQWAIDTDLEEDKEYLITVDLLNLTINIQIVNAIASTPPFSSLWIVGDASESGWDVNNPAAFTQNSNNPFEFYYEGHLNPGNFKILAGSTGDFCGDWYKPSVDNQLLEEGVVIQNSGCDVDDNKWLVSEATKGRYKITIDTQNNTISFNLINLYIIGDGGPNGWNINTPTPMDYINGEYVFIGELGADNATGEFKISKFKGDWCDGDWINPENPSQSIVNTSFITTISCDGSDNKWKLIDGQAGTYEVRINLDTEMMSFTKQ